MSRKYWPTPPFLGRSNSTDWNEIVISEMFLLKRQHTILIAGSRVSNSPSSTWTIVSDLETPLHCIRAHVQSAGIAIHIH